MKKFLYSLALLLISTIISVQTLHAAEVIGQVLYQDDSTRPVNNVKVILKNVDDNSFSTYITGGDGYYYFYNLPNGNYQVTGSKTLPGGGVTLLDAQMVAAYLNGQIQFNSLQMLAADVNGSGNVTWGDHQLILNHIRKGTPFPAGPWQFETEIFSLFNLKEGIPKGIGGTCSGDVGGTFVPTINNINALPIAQEGNITISAGKPFTTSIEAREEFSIIGAGIIINYPSELMQIESVEFKGYDYEYSIADGQIRLVWSDFDCNPVTFSKNEAIITLHGISTLAFTEDLTANLSFAGTTSFVDPSLREITKLHLASPVIRIKKDLLKLSSFPNPFTASTSLRIYTPEDGIGTIEIYTATGKLYKVISAGNLNAGDNEISLNGTQMPRGYYLCKIRVQTETNELINTIKILKAQ